jgi:DNA-binding transcriptional regulator WhiA
MIIPKEPSVPLKNYLMILRKDIKIIGASDLLKEWHSSHLKSYKFISEKIGISESFYRSCINGKVAVPIWVIRLINGIDNNLIDKIYNREIYFTARNKKDLLPKSINPNLAYLIGYLHGDGHIDSNGKRISFFDKYIGQLEFINQLVGDLFNVKGSIYLRKNNFFNSTAPTLDIRRVTINSFLSDVIGLKRGKREENVIPKIIKNNKILLKWYLCGLFDAEGSMPLNPKKRRDIYIDIAMKDKTLISSIKEILEKEFGIKSYGPYIRIAKNNKIKNSTTESELRIRKLSEIKKFLSIIRTAHPDKIRRRNLMRQLLENVPLK